MQKALAPEISTWPDENPQLIGSKCADCGATVFPVQDHCPKCSGAQMSDVLLPRQGTVIAWTTQGFPPGACDPQLPILHREISLCLPLDDLREDGWLAFSEAGGPLPGNRGGPFRLTVAEGSTLCWNVKRVATLRVTAGPEPDDVPENPPH